MNFLISGISGFIGSHLAEKIRASGHTVLSISRDFSVSDETLETPNVYLLKDDKTPIDVFIHCAASHPSHGCNAKAIFSGNVTLTQKLLNWASNRRPEVFIFLSTISVYGKPRPGPLLISSPTIHPTIYGQAKKQSESLVQNWGQSNNVATHCVRLPAVLGKHEHLTFLPRLIKALRSGDEINTHSLKSLFNHIVHVDDVCRFLVTLSKENRRSSITQLASSQPCELETIVNTACDYFNIEETHICPDTLETSFVDISDAEKLGFQPKPTMDLLYQRLDANLLSLL
ncbi:NAD(P)-dependent oxidoreductase [Alphaproteobacteria bacterium]|nr:NAD(P)-dependent oxidoreductase [Alphaproteobacteria bacterium]